MPNDPRVKFHKGGKICRKDIEYLKKHPECYGFVKHNAAFGSGRGNRSIFEDGTPPELPPSGGGEQEPSGGTTTITDFVDLSPSVRAFNAGEITGITIGALAAGATLELSRRAYLKYLEEERRKKGMRPVPTTDAPIKARKRGRLVESARDGVRGISTAIQADFAPLSIESSPSSSGTTTPSARSARSSAGSSEDLQSARSRPLSGTTTPAPAQISRADPTINDPNRLSSVFTTDTGTIGVAPTQTTKPTPIRKPDVALDLQNEIEMRQLELNIENARIVPDDRYFNLVDESAPHRLPREGISEGRKNRLKSEIKALERQIEMANLRPAPLQPLPELPYTESLFNVLTPEEKLTLERTSLFDINDPLNIADMTQEQFNAFTERNKMNIQRKPGDVSPEIDRFMFLEGAIENIELKLLNPQMPPERRQTLVVEQTKLKNTLATEQKAFNDANIRRAAEQAKKINIPQEVEVKTRGASTMEIMRKELQKMGSRKGGIKIQPTTERPPTGGITPESGRATMERIRDVGQPMETEMRGSSLRTPVAPAPVEARVETYMGRDIQSTAEVSERMAAGVGIDFNEQPAPRPAQPQEDFGTELKDARGLTFRDKPLDRFNNMYELMTERWRAYYSESIPTAPEGMTEIESKKYIMEQILKEQAAAGDPITSGDTEQKVITLEEALDRVQTAYDRTDPPASKEITTKKSLRPDQKRKLTKNTELLATEEQRLRPTQFAGEAQAIVQARQSTAGTSTETRAPAGQPSLEELSARAAAPEIAARRRMSVPELTPPPTAAPEERTSFAERRAFFEETSKVKPPTGEPAPSAPPSAPETEVATPREGAIREQTPAERAAFAEQVTSKLNKGPGKQKMKLNIGKTNTSVRNPLDIFVNPEYRNMPNTEIHPSSKAFRGTLTEISARVPRLTPIRSNLISISSNAGGMVGGLAAGYFAGKAMSDYFAQHPAKNYNEQYGQALATSFVGMAVGTIAQQVVSAVIRAGVSYAVIGAVEGGISGLGLGPVGIVEGIGEAAVYTLAAVTAQMEMQRYLENAGYDHAHARMGGSLAATAAASGTNVAFWVAHGGPINLAGDIAFLTNEIFILGFGIYSMVTEHYAGEAEDDEEEAIRQANIEDKRRYDALVAEQKIKIDKTLAVNEVRKNYVLALRSNDYDFDKTLATFTEEEKRLLGVYDKKGEVDPGLSFEEFKDSLQEEFNPFATSREGLTGDTAPPPVLSREDQLKRDAYMAYVNWYANNLMNIPQKPFDFDSEGAKLLDTETGGSWTSTANVHAATAVSTSSYKQPLINEAQQQIMDAYHNDRKPIEEMDPEVIRYADLDPGFRQRYETYIVMDSQARILLEFNNTQHTYHDMDPELVAIASRDPDFFGYADEYYKVLSNQARDLGLSIREVARLNALDANNQAIEVGKLNEARIQLIQQQQALNQPIIDRYNASIIQEISAYGDNFDAIIRNINDQALLTGHTFLYATNRADLYRQLHLEMPEIEIIEPEIDPNQPDATFQPSKGRQIGDTQLYNYRYNLTDAQNKELDEDAVNGKYLRDNEAMERNARRIYERDRYLFEETDAEKAAGMNLTLEEYYAKFNITPPVDEIKEWTPATGKGGVPDGRYRRSDGSIETYRNNILVNTDTSQIELIEPLKYDPTLSSQPDGLILMPDTSVREYKNGLVVRVEYNNTSGYGLTPDEINKAETQTTPQTLFSGERTMPDGTTRTYRDGKIVNVNFPSNATGAMMKANDVKQLNRNEGLYYGEPTITAGIAPTETQPTETQPTGTEITYEQLQQKYPETYKNLKRKYGSEPDGPVQIEASLRRANNLDFNETTGTNSTGTTGVGLVSTTPIQTTPIQTTPAASAQNLAVAPGRAPATTSMPEDTTPGIATP